jgi:hypothetical protein
MRARVRRFAAKYWPLFTLWCVAIVLVRWWLNAHGFSPSKDAWLLFCVAMLIVVSVCITVVETEKWTIRGLGVLGLIAFSGGLYGLTGSVALWDWHTLTQHDFNWLRATIIVSAPLLLISQLIYIGGGVRARWQQWRTARINRP